MEWNELDLVQEFTVEGQCSKIKVRSCRITWDSLQVITAQQGLIVGACSDQPVKRCAQIIKSESITFFTAAGNLSVAACRQWGKGHSGTECFNGTDAHFLVHWTTSDASLSHVSETVNFVMYDQLWSAWIPSPLPPSQLHPTVQPPQESV